MADVALTRVKAEGKYYLPGEEVPDLEDADSLKEKGVIGSAADAAKLKKERDDAVEAAEEAEAEALEKRAEADALTNEANAILTPNVSVTDEEAKALNKKNDEDEEEPAPKATTTTVKPANK